MVRTRSRTRQLAQAEQLDVEAKEPVAPVSTPVRPSRRSSRNKTATEPRKPVSSARVSRKQTAKAITPKNQKVSKAEREPLGDATNTMDCDAPQEDSDALKIEWDMDELVQQSQPDDDQHAAEDVEEECGGELRGEAAVVFQGKHTKWLYTSQGTCMGKEEIKQLEPLRITSKSAAHGPRPTFEQYDEDEQEQDTETLPQPERMEPADENVEMLSEEYVSAMRNVAKAEGFLPSGSIDPHKKAATYKRF